MNTWITLNTLMFGQAALSSLWTRRRDLFVGFIFNAPLVLTMLIDFIFSPGIVGLICSSLYFISFIFIIFTANSILGGILICIFMQFIFNHIVWGTVVGILESLLIKRILK